MLAMSVRVSPCSARCGPRSVGRATEISPSASLTVMSCETVCCSSPRGPLTRTSPGSTVTSTPLGTGMTLRPMRLMALPHEADHLAAHAALRGLAAGDHAGRGGQDGRAEAAQDLGQAIVLGVDAATGLRDALQARNH